VIANRLSRSFDEVRIRCKNAKELSCEPGTRFVVVVGCDFSLSEHGRRGFADVVQQCGPHERAGIGTFIPVLRSLVNNQQCVIPDASLRMVPRRLRRIPQPFQHIERILTEHGGTGEFR